MALGPDFQLRDVYNPTNVTDLAKRIKKIWAKFDQNAFKKAILPTLNTLDFGERSALIRRSLEIHLPEDFRKAASILVDSLAPELESESIDADWNSFINIPTAEYISYNGHDHFDTSMNALYEITKRFSSEFSIRSFLDKDSKRALSLMKKWTRDKNMHVRRLVSEGSRPRLPLGMALRKFKKDPRPVIELLELLKDDSELYVRRSVANNLNDISKDNPDIVVTLLSKWKKPSDKNRMWLIRHALRTLFKQGHKGALELMGYAPPKVKISDIKFSKKRVPIGSTLNFEFEIESQADQKLMIDYGIHFVKANGSTSRKVFKYIDRGFKKNEQSSFCKKHSFKQLSTRKHYPGIHTFEIIINGQVYRGYSIKVTP